MERLLIIGLCAACLLSALTVNAAAENIYTQTFLNAYLDDNNPVSDRFSEILEDRSMVSFDGIAEELSSIGVFRGTGDGFALEQIPDRLQACTMTVRMLGKEAEALEQYAKGEITCPFVDVTQDWAKPYLAWLYANGIVLGVGDGRFGNSDCTAQMYVTFMLRALGYSDTGKKSDFSFEKALDFAEQRYLYDPAWEGTAFDRGTMAAVTYQTLCCPVKYPGGSIGMRLIEKLCQDDVIDRSDAQPMIEKIYLINDFADKLKQCLPYGERSYEKIVDTIETHTLTDSTGILTTDHTSKDHRVFSCIRNENHSVIPWDMSFIRTAGDVTDDTQSTLINQWYVKDDVIYIVDGDSRFSLNLKDYFSVYEDFLKPSFCNIDRYCITDLKYYYCYFDSVSHTYDDLLHTYTFHLPHLFMHLTDGYAESFGTLVSKEENFDVVYTYRLTQSIGYYGYGYEITHSLDCTTDDGTEYTVSDSVMKTNNLWYEVYVSFPDFSGYKNLEIIFSN